MFSKILKYLLVSYCMIISWVSAEDITIPYEQNISSGNLFRIDLTQVQENLEAQYDTDIFFEWDIRWASTQNWSVFERTFISSGEKEINLTIYRNISQQKNLIYSQNIQAFVYDQSLPFLYDASLPNEEINNFIQVARNSWIYLYDLWTYHKNNISGRDILEKLKQYTQQTWNKSDYIGLWGEKEFILNAVSQANKQAGISWYSEPINVALFSSFNSDILESFVRNFLSEKSNINTIIISDESTRFQTIEQPSRINNLIQHLEENNHNYKNVKNSQWVEQFFILSKFVSILSSAGFPAESIYLIILLPILLVGLSIMKHIIWFSPLGIIIPVWITLLLFQVGIIVTALLLISLFIVNIILWKAMSRYNLLYTPKISLLLSINIVVMIGVLNILFSYNMIPAHIESVLFIIMFILVSEKLITLIVSKEFREYKYNIVYTLSFSLFSYVLLHFDTIKIFLLAYPEIIIIFIPVNFWIGRFTGLRITEYFRFRDVIHSIEEE